MSDPKSSVINLISSDEEEVDPSEVPVKVEKEPTPPPATEEMREDPNCSAVGYTSAEMVDFAKKRAKKRAAEAVTAAEGCSSREPKVVTSGPATLKQETTLDGVKVVQSASARAGAAAEARWKEFSWYHRQHSQNLADELAARTAQIRKDAEAGWKAACGQADPEAKGPATTVVKSEPGVGGSANTVVKSEPGVGGSVVDQGETTDEWSEEEERPPKRAVRKSHRTDNPLWKAMGRNKR